jgi:DNA gyrase/topoisomerase IV subunit A
MCCNSNATCCACTREHCTTQVKARDHIVQGMLLALAKVEEVIDVVRGSKDTATARAALMGEVCVTVPQ